MKLLENKNIIITGGSRGIGRGIALVLAKHGANIAFTYSSSVDSAISLTEEISALNVKCKGYQSNAANFEDSQKLVDQILLDFDNIDVLINNAGIIRDRSILKMTRDEWDMVQSVNVDSLFITTKAVLPYMKASNYGRIISASSINAFQGAFGQTNYSASKAAIVGFTHSLCREVGKYNITVNAVAPGFIKSEMTDSMPEEIIKAGIAQIPVGRIGTSEDMAHAYLFLASKEAGFVSGHTLHANGGAMPF